MERRSIPDLAAFALLAELRSFRRAGEVMGVSASALSHRLRRMETALGVEGHAPPLACSLRQGADPRPHVLVDRGQAHPVLEPVVDLGRRDVGFDQEEHGLAGIPEVGPADLLLGPAHESDVHVRRR